MSVTAAPTPEDEARAAGAALIDRSGSGPLLLQRRFGPLTASFVMGAFTDNMLKQVLIIGIPYGVIAIPFLSREAAGPILGAMYPLGIFLFSPLAGQVADRFPKAALLRRIKFVEAGLMAAAALGFILNSGVILFAVLVAMGAQTAFFNPVRHAAMPQLLRPDELVRGNGVANGGLFLAILLALALGSGLGDDEGGVMIAALVLVGVGALGWLASLAVPDLPAADPDHRVQYNPFPQLVRMFRMATGAPGVARPMLGVGFFWAQGAAVTVLMPYLVHDVAGAKGEVVALIMALSAVGMAVGSFAAGAVVKKRSGLGVAAAGLALSVAFAVDLFFVNRGISPGEELMGLGEFVNWPTGLHILIASVGVSTANALFYTPLIAAVQRRAPDKSRAQIMSAANLLNSGLAMVGALSIQQFTKSGAQPEQFFLALAAAQLCILVYMGWRRRRAPEGLGDG